MPQLLKNAVEIAVERQTDILLMAFGEADRGEQFQSRNNSEPDQQMAREWLESNGFTWEDCFHPSVYGFITAPWDGTLVVDVPVDGDDVEYRRVVGYFERADGRPVFARVRLQILPFEVAKRANNSRTSKALD